jgi:hypothetical protein
VLTGGGADHYAAQAEKAKDPVGVGANLAGLVGVLAVACYAKGVNQSRRDQELGILNKDGKPTINAGNFAAATERYEDLGGQSKALIFVPVAVGATVAVATSAFLAAPIGGCCLVVQSMGLATLIRRYNLQDDLEDAESKILEDDSQSNLVNVLAEAHSFLANLRQL